MTTPFSLRIVVVDGDPDRLRLIESSRFGSLLNVPEIHDGQA
jgi:hypothetical protein